MIFKMLSVFLIIFIKLIIFISSKKVESSAAFAWQSQLKHRFVDSKLMIMRNLKAATKNIKDMLNKDNVSLSFSGGTERSSTALRISATPSSDTATSTLGTPQDSSSLH